MNTFAYFSLFWDIFKNDRMVQSGAGSSAVSLWGASQIALISDVQAWVALFAAVFGGLSALATFTYVCIKIRRLIRHPRSLD